MEITYKVEGLDKLLQKTSAPASLIGPAMRTALTKSALLVEGEAKRLVPVDTGNLRRTITHRVDSAAIPTFAEIGTNAPYAKAVHEGRRAGAAPPPTQALAGWASRHKIPAGALFALARRIGRKGIKGRPFLKDALAAMRGRVDGALNEAARTIESAWGSR